MTKTPLIDSDEKCQPNKNEDWGPSFSMTNDRLTLDQTKDSKIKTKTKRNTNNKKENKNKCEFLNSRDLL
jgi:hypothetical protein